MDGESRRHLGVEEGALLGHHLARLGDGAHLGHGRGVHEKEHVAPGGRALRGGGRPERCEGGAGVLRVPDVRLRGLRLRRDPEDVLEEPRVEDRDVGLAQDRRLPPERRMAGEVDVGAQDQQGGAAALRAGDEARASPSRRRQLGEQRRCRQRGGQRGHLEGRPRPLDQIVERERRQRVDVAVRREDTKSGSSPLARNVMKKRCSPSGTASGRVPATCWQ